MPCLGRPLGGGKGAPCCVSSGQLIAHPSRGAKGLHPGFSSAPVGPLLLHSVTVMSWTSSWGALLGPDGALL